MRIFKSNFIHGVVRCEIILEDFFKSNEEIIKEYLSHRVNLSDGLAENIIQDGLCKIFTNSIIENSKYLENTEKFISNVTFNQKKSKNYNSSKLIRLEEVLSDVTECNKSDYNILYLFITIDYYTDLIYSDLDNNKSYATIQKHVIKKFNKVYDRLLDNYNEKKQFLKYLY